MTEAISALLAFAFLGALVATIVGITIGFIRKRWNVAIIAGSVGGGLFALIILVMGLTGEFDEETTVAPVPQAVIPTPEPTPTEQAPTPTFEPTPESTPVPPTSEPTATAVPTPVPIGGFDVSRDDVHYFLELFEFKNVHKEDCPGTPCTSVSAANPNVEIWLYGSDDALHTAMTVGDTRENDTATGEAAALMLNAIMPDSSEAVIDWILTDAAASLDNKGGGGIEQTLIGGNQVILGVSTKTGALTLTIKD